VSSADVVVYGATAAGVTAAAAARAAGATVTLVEPGRHVGGMVSGGLSWTDVGVLSAWQLSIIGTGFYGASATAFGVLAILLGIAAFWVAVWQLVTDGANRMQASMAEFERLAAEQPGAPASGASGGAAGSAGPGVRRPPFDDGGDDVIIIHEVRE